MCIRDRKYPCAEENLDVIDQLYGDSGLYRFFNQIPTAFVQRFGSTDCRQLTQDYGEWFHRERYLKCRAIVMESAIMAVDFIAVSYTHLSFNSFIKIIIIGAFFVK